MRPFCTPYINDSTPYHSDNRATSRRFVRTMEIICTVSRKEPVTL